MNRSMRVLVASAALFICVTWLYAIYNNQKNTHKMERTVQTLKNQLACLTKGGLPSGDICLEDSEAMNGGNEMGKGKVMEEQKRKIQILRNKVACLTDGVLPSGGFCLDDSKAVNGGNEMWDGKLCAGLEDIFGHSSVGDLGAGLGHYGNCFLRLSSSGIHTTDKKQAKKLADNYKKQMNVSHLLNKPQVIRSWEGYDGALNIEKVTGGRVHPIDLAEPLNLGHRFDWVMSLEVGEHIPSKKEKYFMDNLVSHACTGIVMSWGVPGQAGHHHVNNRPNKYIQEQMALRGLSLDMEAQTHLRKKTVYGYFKNTLMVYKFPEKKC